MLEQLIADLRQPDAAIRYEAAQQLGDFREFRAVEALIAALPDENAKVQYAAFSSLIKIGAPESALPLILWLIDSPDSKLWELMKLNIGLRLRRGLIDMVQRGDTALADHLNTVLAADHLDARQRTLYMRLLGKTGDKRQFDPFLELLVSDDLLISVAAAESLGYMGDERATEALIAILSDRLNTSEQLRDVSAEALGRIGDRRAYDALIEALMDESEWVRRAAAVALGELGDNRAIEALSKAMSDDSTMVQDAAFEALKRFSSGSYSTIMSN
ncbi:HEAT repeat domain-containing protein [Anaerolineae bacterium CFX9]|nr:HEAT repeat domain-containing protein [Anaerolineae bacterium CFX9]